jgi:predicted metal-binding membrane protein
MILAGITAAAWIYLLTGAARLPGVTATGGMMMMQAAWTGGDATLALVVSATMMAAMMLPSAAPTILHVGRGGIAQAMYFTAGYLLVWAAFGLATTLAQWGLDAARLLSDAMAIKSPVITGALVAAIGMYQLTPMKRGCLRDCRASDGDRHRADGRRAWKTVRHGLRYGVSCVGCCGAAMLLLFVGGVMNLVWAAAIGLWAFVERRLPWGDRVARLIAVGLLAWGIVELTTAPPR